MEIQSEYFLNDHGVLLCRAEQHQMTNEVQLKALHMEHEMPHHASISQYAGQPLFYSRGQLDFQEDNFSDTAHPHSVLMQLSDISQRSVNYDKFQQYQQRSQYQYNYKENLSGNEGFPSELSLQKESISSHYQEFQPNNYNLQNRHFSRQQNDRIMQTNDSQLQCYSSQNDTLSSQYMYQTVEIQEAPIKHLVTCPHHIRDDDAITVNDSLGESALWRRRILHQDNSSKAIEECNPLFDDVSLNSNSHYNVTTDSYINDSKVHNMSLTEDSPQYIISAYSYSKGIGEDYSKEKICILIEQLGAILKQKTSNCNAIMVLKTTVHVLQKFVV